MENRLRRLASGILGQLLFDKDSPRGIDATVNYITK